MIHVGTVWYEWPDGTVRRVIVRADVDGADHFRERALGDGAPEKAPGLYESG